MLGAPQNLFYIVKDWFHPYARNCRPLPYNLPKGTVLVVRKGTSFAEDGHCAADVPDLAMTLDAEEIGISWSMRENNALRAHVGDGPFSQEDYKQGIWYNETTGAYPLHALIRRAGSGVVLRNVEAELVPLLRNLMSSVASEPEGEPIGCFRPVYGQEADGPYRVEKFEPVRTITLL